MLHFWYCPTIFGYSIMISSSSPSHFSLRSSYLLILKFINSSLGLFESTNKPIKSILHFYDWAFWFLEFFLTLFYSFHLSANIIRLFFMLSIFYFRTLNILISVQLISLIIPKCPSHWRPALLIALSLQHFSRRALQSFLLSLVARRVVSGNRN